MQIAQLALTDSFFRTIGVSYQNIPPRDEREALWELAQLDRAHSTVRGNLLNRWFATVEAFMRGAARGGQGFRAAMGLNVEYHRIATSNAAELGRRLTADLENSREIFDRPSGLGEKTSEMTKTKSVPVVSFGVDPILEEFGPFSASQRLYIADQFDRNPDYVQRQAKIVRSEPRENLAATLLAALKDDWQPARKSVKASPKPRYWKPDPVEGLCAEEKAKKELAALRSSLNTS